MDERDIVKFEVYAYDELIFRFVDGELKGFARQWRKDEADE